MALKKDGNDNIKRKLAADGGSQPSKVEIIKIYKDFNSKFEYAIKFIANCYETIPNFYIQRHEFNAIRDIIWKDSVWCVNAPAFEYNGVKHLCTPLNIEIKHQELARLNNIYVFYGIGRHQNGDIQIHGKYL